MPETFAILWCLEHKASIPYGDDGYRFCYEDWMNETSESHPLPLDPPCRVVEALVTVSDA